jgi:hypothetical protein
MLLITQWVQSAYQDIQNMSMFWEFLRADFSFSTIAATSTYTPTAAGLTELLNWRTTDYDSIKLYLTSDGVSGEQYISQIDWDNMRGIRLLGSSSTQTGKPTEYAIRPNKSIVLWPIPDAIYTVSGEYYKKPQTLTANADEPIFPSAYHMILVWLAMRYSGAYQAAPEKYAHADNEYRRLLSGLKRDQLPRISMGDPLA